MRRGRAQHEKRDKIEEKNEEGKIRSVLFCTLLRTNKVDNIVKYDENKVLRADPFGSLKDSEDIEMK